LKGNRSRKVKGLEENFTKIVGEPIYVGNRGLIPIIEYYTYLRNVESDKLKLKTMVTGFTLESIAFFVVEDGKEWVLPVNTKNTELSYYLEEIPELIEKLQETRENLNSKYE
jgi:protein involved in sex pheromone biosynthesis